MEFFRWVLILSGIGLLGATWYLGRRRVNSIDYRRSIADDAFDPSIEELSVPITGRPSEEPVFESRLNDDDDFLNDEEIDQVIPPRAESESGTEVEMGISDDFAAAEPAMSPDGSTRRSASRSGLDSVKSFANAVKQANQRNKTPKPERESIADEFEPYAEAPQLEEKLVTVNVMAGRDRIFGGKELKAVFDDHGYYFGDMSIYHCSHEGDELFSVANMLKPGTFDLDEMDGFETPGITLFMNLPVALDADVAFDFLIKEASDLAEELGGQLRDADRSTLSKQTIQHMREDIQQYMFRQKRTASMS